MIYCRRGCVIAYRGGESMKPVIQTRFGGPTSPVAEQGNCFAACVASLLELPLTEVEIYLEGLNTTEKVEGYWWRNFVQWCNVHALVPLYLQLQEGYTPEQAAYGKPGLRYIVCGESPRGLGHAVVYLDGQLDHDPHPSGDGLVSVDAYVLLLKKF